MSTNELLPFKVDVYFYYKCPNCGVEHLKEFLEVKEIGKVLCYCGQILELKRMEKVSVRPSYIKVENIPKIINKNDIQSKVYGTLKRLGYSTQSIKESMNKVVYTNDIEQYIKDCINNI
jgi:Holliday junction resolvasome RuvABC DNA-binding subunit